MDNLEHNDIEIEREYSEEEKQFLDSLKNEEDAEITVQDKAQDDIKKKAELVALEAALPFAARGVSFVDGVLKAKDKRLAFEDDEKEQLTGAIAPVLVKYGAEPPPWLVEYGPELTLLATVSIIGFGKYSVMQDIRKEEIAIQRAHIEAIKAAKGESHAAATQ